MWACAGARVHGNVSSHLTAVTLILVKRGLNECAERAIKGGQHLFFKSLSN